MHIRLQLGIWMFSELLIFQTFSYAPFELALSPIQQDHATSTYFFCQLFCCAEPY